MVPQDGRIFQGSRYTSRGEKSLVAAKNGAREPRQEGASMGFRNRAHPTWRRLKTQFRDVSLMLTPIPTLTYGRPMNPDDSTLGALTSAPTFPFA